MSVPNDPTRFPRRRIFGAVILFAAVAVALIFRPVAPTPKAGPPLLPEVLRTDLQLREGKLLIGASTNVFSGWMLERYADGALKSRSAISNGLLHGLSEGWHTNGQVQVREHFQAGVSHGTRLKYYSDGAKMSEATIVQGKLEGLFRRWHPNGKLAEQAELRSGVPHGDSTSYFPSGSLKTRAKLQDGEVLEKQTWRDGEENS